MAKPRSIKEALEKLHLPGWEGKEAYEFLYMASYKVMLNYLRYKQVGAEDAEDIAAKILLYIFETRTREGRRFESEAEWFKYLRLAAMSKLIDLKKKRRDLPFPDNWDEADPNAENEMRVIGRLFKESLYDVADRIWLGEKPDDFDAKRLAASYFYVHNKPISDVLDFVSTTSAKEKPTTNEELLAWISDVSVLRTTAYDALYFGNLDLAAHLLGVKRSELNSYRKGFASCQPGAVAVGSWNWGEVQVILYRYGHGMSLHQVPKSVSFQIDSVQVEAICDRCQNAFPFVKIMDNIWQRMDGHHLRADSLKKNSLWKRLVFQYHCYEELQQEDILQRITPPAAVVGYSLKNINTWVHSRFIKEFMAFLGKEVGNG